MMENNNKVKVGISHGDFNGIGYEIIFKTFKDNRMFDFCTPIIYGSSKIANYYKKLLTGININLNIIKDVRQAQDNRINIINIFDDEVKVEPGKSSKTAGELSFKALEAATKDLNKGIDVLVTAPINKDNIQSDSFNFPGHTEYLSEKFGKDNELMVLATNSFKVAVATGHIPVKDVADNINEELILKKLSIFNNSLINDFVIRKPKIAVLGLNPHSGDNGLLGKEEEEIIIPAIEKAKENGILTFGPFPADGFFGTDEYRKFDGILAMYHDQGLIPFKVIAFEEGVNFTAGLSIIRTSPDHGTGYDIAGEDKANPASFRNAVYMAVDIYNNHIQEKEINANPLPFLHEDMGKDESIEDVK